MGKQIISDEYRRMQKLAGIITEIEAVASDGGYYNKPEYGVTVSREEANRINQAIEDFKQDIQDPELPMVKVDKSEQGQINWKIIQDLQKNWNVKFEYDSDEGVDLVYLAPNQDIQDVLDGLEHADQLFYDKIESKPEQGIGLDNLKRVGGNYLSPHITR